MSLDKSIRPLIIALNQIGIRTTVSCSGILEDHYGRELGISTPYLCINLFHSDRIKSKYLQHIFLDSGFEIWNKKTKYEHQKRFYEWYNHIDPPSKSALWEFEMEASTTESYRFDFGLGDFKFGNPGQDDVLLEMFDKPEWQVKIKAAWIEIYRRVLRMWFC